MSLTPISARHPDSANTHTSTQTHSRRQCYCSAICIRLRDESLILPVKTLAVIYSGSQHMCHSSPLPSAGRSVCVCACWNFGRKIQLCTSQMRENKHWRFTDVNPSPIAIILLIFEHVDVSDLMHSGPGYLHVMLHKVDVVNKQASASTASNLALIAFLQHKFHFLNLIIKEKHLQKKRLLLWESTLKNNRPQPIVQHLEKTLSTHFLSSLNHLFLSLSHLFFIFCPSLSLINDFHSLTPLLCSWNITAY